MKKLLMLIAFIGLCLQSASAGNACHYAFRNPNLPTSSTAFTANAPVNASKNAAYFNTKDAPIRTFPKALQTRSSAISITEADFLAIIQPNMRQEIRTALSGGSVLMNIGVADMNNPQTWTLPTNILSSFTQTRNADFIPLAGVPIAARVAGATHISKRTYLDPDDGHTLVEYAHYQFNAGQQLNELGTTIVDVSDADAVANHGESAQLYANSPLDLNNVFTSHTTDYLDDAEFPKTVATNAVTVDGFGTINNPFGAGTLNCLRMSIVQTNAEYTTNVLTPSSTATQYFVGWVTKEGFRFYGKKSLESSSGAGVSLSNLEISRFMPTTILAVELLDFQGKSTKNGVDLTWTTASEKNNDYYDIERSENGKTFKSIGQVKGNGTTNVKNNYTFFVEGPLSKTTYFRLKQTDFDRTSTTSNIIAIAPFGGLGAGIKIYPNPSNSAIISVELPYFGETKERLTERVSIVNSIGQTVFQQKTNEQTTFTVDVSTFATGVYFIKTTTMNEQSNVVKFIKN